jgi:hypothetical protein
VAQLVDKTTKNPNKVILVIVGTVVTLWGGGVAGIGMGHMEASGIAGQVLFLDWMVVVRCECLIIIN